MPTPVSAPTESPVASALTVVLLLISLGLLLLGASAVSAWRGPWPALTEPLYTHRVDLAAAGAGAIALALLWLNVAVLF